MKRSFFQLHINIYNTITPKCSNKIFNPSITKIIPATINIGARINNVLKTFG